MGRAVPADDLLDTITEALEAGTPVCSVDGCEAHVKTSGLCNAHYKRLRRTGTTDRPVTVERLCPVCGVTFRTSRHLQVYCARTCKDRAHGRREDRGAVNARSRRWAKTEKGRAAIRARARVQYRRDRPKAIARAAVGDAIRKGRLTRPLLCEDCGSERPLQGHHHLGYDREHWLTVTWLCVPCHTKEHHAQAAS